MRTIARRLMRSVSDPGTAVSVIVGLVVGVLLGGNYEARPSTRTDPARRDRSYLGDPID